MAIDMNQMTEADLDRKIHEYVNKRVNALHNELRVSLRIYLKPIQHEINGQLKALVYDVFIQTFTEHYGNNYDIVSLLDSINCFFDDNFRPQVLYDENIFKFNNSLSRDTRLFNQNVDHTDWHNLYDRDEFIALEEDGAFDIDDNPYDAAIEELGADHIKNSDVFSPINKSQMRGGFTPLQVVYKKATYLALLKFDEYYEKTIKPNIAKKYGFDL